MKLWSCYDSDYIQGQFEELKSSVKEITLWQNFEDLREKYTGVLTQVSPDTCVLKLDEKYKNAYGRINVQVTLFFHCESEDILFKRDIFSISNGLISFKTPYEVKFRDKRISDRFSYKYQDFKNVSFSLESGDEVVTAILTDVSTAGISFVLDQKDRDLLSKDSIVTIKSLTDQEIPQGHKAQVIYTQPFMLSRESDSKLIHVGCSFTEGLDSITYKSIGSVIKKKQQKVKGLDTDGFNGLNPDELEKTISNIRSKNPQLAANISDKVEDIDRLRYLTTEMKRQFLLSVNHDLLATSLRLSSKELILDLLSEVTDSIREEFLEKLDRPKPASAINKAQDEISKFIKEKENSGELVLDPRSFVRYV
ncbi:MAG: hypothetical protein BM556_04735 [Bacteriovorax sp. MedPE-SWde]|nr:MAG: hypothetical protein BM556_04735 [Bacteriovorax sp. MedPE-SWde]